MFGRVISEAEALLETFPEPVLLRLWAAPVEWERDIRERTWLFVMHDDAGHWIEFACPYMDGYHDRWDYLARGLDLLFAFAGGKVEPRCKIGVDENNALC